MPPTSGWATRSSASRPKRRRTKAPRLSSSSGLPRGNKSSRCHAQLAAPREQRGLQKGPEASGRQQKKTFRQRFERAALDDVNFLISGLRRNQPRCQTKTLAEAERPGFSVMNESGPPSTRKSPTRSVAMAPPRRGDASRSRTSMIGGSARRELRDAMRGRQAGDAAADDDDSGHGETARG